MLYRCVRMTHFEEGIVLCWDCSKGALKHLTENQGLPQVHSSCRWQAELGLTLLQYELILYYVL